jgi:hypothetical protein
MIVDKIIYNQLFWSIVDQLFIWMTKISIQKYHQSIYLIINKLFIDNKIILIENSIKIIDDYLLSIKLVTDNQEKSMKTHSYRWLLVDNRLKKLNTATLKC